MDGAAEPESLAISDRDDAPHEHGGAPGWLERLTFSFFDDASGFAGVARVEQRPREGEAEGTLTLFLPGGALATVLAKGKMERHAPPAAGRLILERREALRSWSIRCKDVALLFPNVGPAGLPKPGERTGAAGQCDVDLTFEAWMAPAGALQRDKHTDEMGFVQVVSSGRFEQAGRVTGRVRMGPNAATIDGTGIRERLWGVPPPPRTARAFTAAFGPSLAFSVTLTLQQARDVSTGWACRVDDVRAVRALHVEEETEGRVMTGARIRFTDDAGDEVGLDAETLATMPSRVGGARVRQSLMRFRAGERATFGLAELVDPA